jgi:hypothetical protein
MRLRFLLAVLLLVCAELLFIHIGRRFERHRIAEALRTGRLTVIQRTDHLADEIEGKRPWVREGQ